MTYPLVTQKTLKNPLIHVCATKADFKRGMGRKMSLHSKWQVY